MKPEVWGREMWHTIHVIAMNFPIEPSREDQQNYKVFFENLHQVIPCYKCSLNYVKHINEIPLSAEILMNNSNLFEWTIDLHNLVNRDLGKPVWSYDRAWRRYRNLENMTYTQGAPLCGRVATLVFLALLISIVYLIYYYEIVLPKVIIKKL